MVYLLYSFSHNSKRSISTEANITKSDIAGSGVWQRPYDSTSLYSAPSILSLYSVIGSKREHEVRLLKLKILPKHFDNARIVV